MALHSVLGTSIGLFGAWNEWRALGLLLRLLLNDRWPFELRALAIVRTRCPLFASCNCHFAVVAGLVMENETGLAATCWHCREVGSGRLQLAINAGTAAAPYKQHHQQHQ